MNIRNAFRDSDSFVIAVSFDGNTPVTGYTYANEDKYQPRSFPPGDPRFASVRWFTPAASLAEVMNSAGNLLWQDKANNLVWVKFKGGVVPHADQPASELVNAPDDVLYHGYSIALFRAP